MYFLLTNKEKKMEILIDVHNDKAEQFIEFIKTLDYVQIKKTKDDIKRFAGIWKDKNISIEDIREKAWKR